MKSHFYSANVSQENRMRMIYNMNYVSNVNTTFLFRLA